MRRLKEGGAMRRLRPLFVGTAPLRRVSTVVEARELLGIDVTASQKDISRRQRELAMQLHPDLPGGCAKRMAAVNTAAKLLQAEKARHSTALSPESEWGMTGLQSVLRRAVQRKRQAADARVNSAAAGEQVAVPATLRACAEELYSRQYAHLDLLPHSPERLADVQAQIGAMLALLQSDAAGVADLPRSASRFYGSVRRNLLESPLTARLDAMFKRPMPQNPQPRRQASVVLLGCEELLERVMGTDEYFMARLRKLPSSVLQGEVNWLRELDEALSLDEKSPGGPGSLELARYRAMHELMPPASTLSSRIGKLIEERCDSVTEELRCELERAGCSAVSVMGLPDRDLKAATAYYRYHSRVLMFDEASAQKKTLPQQVRDRYAEVLPYVPEGSALQTSVMALSGRATFPAQPEDDIDEHAALRRVLEAPDLAPVRRFLRVRWVLLPFPDAWREAQLAAVRCRHVREDLQQAGQECGLSVEMQRRYVEFQGYDGASQGVKDLVKKFRASLRASARSLSEKLYGDSTLLLMAEQKPDAFLRDTVHSLDTQLQVLATDQSLAVQGKLPASEVQRYQRWLELAPKDSHMAEMLSGVLSAGNHDIPEIGSRAPQESRSELIAAGTAALGRLGMAHQFIASRWVCMDDAELAAEASGLRQLAEQLEHDAGSPDMPPDVANRYRTLQGCLMPAEESLWLPCFRRAAVKE